MFEIIICCFILFAVGYWATLRVMARREDVLHGQFLELETRPESLAATMPVPPPKVPSRPRVPSPTPLATVKLPAKAQPPANEDELSSLLASLKQELKNASKL
jgi:hypothetical protein